MIFLNDVLVSFKIAVLYCCVYTVGMPKTYFLKIGFLMAFCDTLPTQHAQRNQTLEWITRFSLLKKLPSRKLWNLLV